MWSEVSREYYLGGVLGNLCIVLNYIYVCILLLNFFTRGEGEMSEFMRDVFKQQNLEMIFCLCFDLLVHSIINFTSSITTMLRTWRLV